MPKLAALIGEAALPLGSPYPRNRDERWDALLAASGRKSKELKHIFRKHENLYLAFVEATDALNFDALDKQFWEGASENGGFQDAATMYAHSVCTVP